MEVPGYDIIRTIGRGGMATVHLAVQQSLGREVVLKTLDTSKQDGADFLERFVNEGRIVASLRHPHIVTIFDIGKTTEVVYIAMEYVDGGDLKARIQQGIDPDEAVDIVYKVASALEYAHRHGVIHRDVKPANILFRSDGTPLLSDFGIAKSLSVDSELTSTGTILGSPFYMSPEQSEGLVVDGRTDIYSLGVIFYEMLTGERPYQGDSAIKVIMQHIQSPMPVLPDPFGEYQPLLKRMMAKDRDARAPDIAALLADVAQYRKPGEASAQEAAAELEATTASSRASAPAPGAARSFVDSPRFLVAFSALVLLLLAGGGYYVVLESSKPMVLVRRPSTEVLADAAQANLAGGVDLATAAGHVETPVIGAGVEHSDVIKALQWLAKNSLREDRLTHPPADNAYYYYSRLLALDPENEKAKAGFSDIAERFVVLAEQEFSRKNFGQAQAYIALGLQVEPDNEGLISLRSFIDNRKKGFLETLADLFD